MIAQTSPSLFAEVQSAGIPFEVHGTSKSDLYLPNTPTVRAILARHPQHARNAEPFIDRRTPLPSIDVPFAYEPFFSKP